MKDVFFFIWFLLAGGLFWLFVYKAVREIRRNRKAQKVVADFGELQAIRTILIALCKRSPTGEIHIRAEEFNAVRALDKVKAYMSSDNKKVIVRYVKGK